MAYEWTIYGQILNVDESKSTEIITFLKERMIDKYKDIIDIQEEGEIENEKRIIIDDFIHLCHRNRNGDGMITFGDYFRRGFIRCEDVLDVVKEVVFKFHREERLEAMVIFEDDNTDEMPHIYSLKPIWNKDWIRIDKGKEY